jgi:CRP/FNR family transcriptional regulator
VDTANNENELYIDNQDQVIKIFDAAKLSSVFVSRVCIYGSGVTVFWQGDEPEGVFVVRLGWLKLSHVSLAGRPATVDIMGTGSILCLQSVLTGFPFAASCEVIEHCELEYIERDQFLKLLASNQELADHILTTVCLDSGRFLTELCMTGAKVPARERLLHILRDLARSCGLGGDKGVLIRIPLTVNDIGERIGCTRQWTTKLLMELEQMDLILRKQGSITMTNKAMGSSLAGKLNNPVPLLQMVNA